MDKETKSKSAVVLMTIVLQSLLTLPLQNFELLNQTENPPKDAILLVNLGSPNSARLGSVYRYLTEFLNDPKVIDIPFLARLLLVNLVIIPIRVRNSTKAYKLLWTGDGSPLIYHSRQQAELLQSRFPNADIHWAMRYQKPGLTKTLKKIKAGNYKRLLVVPLFPHYAEASSGSVLARSKKVMKGFNKFPVKYVRDFPTHNGYIASLIDRADRFDISSFDHVVMSYHGLPLRHLEKIHGGDSCGPRECTPDECALNSLCYQGQCYETSRALAQGLGLKKNQYTVSFQSRLNKKWTEPFTDKLVIELAQKGAKRVLVFSPAFVADCLETTVEIGDEFSELFVENGGEKLQLVPGLNSSERWIDALADLVEKSL